MNDTQRMQANAVAAREAWEVIWKEEDDRRKVKSKKVQQSRMLARGEHATENAAAAASEWG